MEHPNEQTNQAINELKERIPLMLKAVKKEERKLKLMKAGLNQYPLDADFVELSSLEISNMKESYEMAKKIMDSIEAMTTAMKKAGETEDESDHD